MNLIKKLFGCCEHEWEFKRESTITIRASNYYTDDDDYFRERRTSFFYICKKCLKSKTVIHRE